MTPLETYLRDLRDIRSTGAGVEEESYYHPLAALLNEVGKKLKPKVKCALQLANRGAGKPDGGLFTADQFEHLSDAEPLPGQLPPRGAIEVKPTKDDAWVTAEAKQVTKYWNRYRQVLVTNYRDFVLAGEDAESNPAILETYQLAESDKAFWQAAPAGAERSSAFSKHPSCSLRGGIFIADNRNYLLVRLEPAPASLLARRAFPDRRASLCASRRKRRAGAEAGQRIGYIRGL